MARKRKNSLVVYLHFFAITLIAIVAVFVLDLGARRVNDRLGSSAISEFSDGKFGYQIKYPSNFQLVEGGEIADLIIPNDVYFRTGLIREAEIELSPGAKECAHFGDYIIKKENLLLNGLPLERQVWGGVALGHVYKGVDYNLENDGLCYQLRLYTHSTTSTGSPEDNASLVDTHAEDMNNMFSLVDSIVSSLRFRVK